jgi:hypothetical protein
MRTLRRAYRRRFGRHTRFNFAVVLTIVLVAWVAVPSVARFVNAWAGYSPAHYEPKDLERQTWLERHDPVGLLGSLEWNDVLGIGLFVLVAVVWLTLMPDRGPRRR